MSRIYDDLILCVLQILGTSKMLKLKPIRSYHDLIIPYVGPGFCCSVCCIFFHYEPFHKPIQGCKGYENFEKIGNKEDTYDSKFNLHHFMDFASNEKWKCFAKNCPIHWSEPFHCQGV